MDCRLKIHLQYNAESSRTMYNCTAKDCQRTHPNPEGVIKHAQDDHAVDHYHEDDLTVVGPIQKENVDALEQLNSAKRRCLRWFAVTEASYLLQDPHCSLQDSCYSSFVFRERDLVITALSENYEPRGLTPRRVLGGTRPIRARDYAQSGIAPARQGRVGDAPEWWHSHNP